MWNTRMTSGESLARELGPSSCRQCDSSLPPAVPSHRTCRCVLVGRNCVKSRGLCEVCPAEEMNTLTFPNSRVEPRRLCCSVKVMKSPHPSHWTVWYTWGAESLLHRILGNKSQKHSYFLIIFLKEKNLLFNKFWHGFPPDFITHLKLS